MIDSIESGTRWKAVGQKFCLLSGSLALCQCLAHSPHLLMRLFFFCLILSSFWMSFSHIFILDTPIRRRMMPAMDRELDV